MRTHTLVASLCLAILLAGCGGPAPADAPAQEVIDVATLDQAALETLAAEGDAAAKAEIDKRRRDAEKAAFDAALAAEDEAELDLLAGAGNGWALHRRALKYLESGDRILQRAGFIDMETAAENGPPDAQLWVGTRMAFGLDGYPLTPNSGLMMVERAAKQGHLEAMLRMGELYEGDQFMADPKKALEWYRRAAEAGSEPAKEALARLAPDETRQQE